jgi:hypothetical protein
MSGLKVVALVVVIVEKNAECIEARTIKTASQSNVHYSASS